LAKRMGNLRYILPVFDSHTAGEPTRVILRLPFRIPGNTMEAKRSWFDQHCDALRKLIIAEPRGHHGMFAAILTDPVSEQTQAGVFFLETESTLRMCVHGSMGVAAVLFRMGYRGSELLLDSPAGLIRARALDLSMNEISITNVPSFLVDEVQLTLEGRVIRAQIAWGGNLFALVSSTDLGISLHQENIPALVREAMAIRSQLNCGFRFVHPELLEQAQVDLVEVYDEEQTPPKNIVVFGRGQVDRSPCGTGMSAKMAVLYREGRLNEGRDYRYQSILGTQFVGRIVGTGRVGSYDAIVPEITGGVYLSGAQFLLLEDADPFPAGFLLNAS